MDPKLVQQELDRRAQDRDRIVNVAASLFSFNGKRMGHVRRWYVWDVLARQLGEDVGEHGFHRRVTAALAQVGVQPCILHGKRVYAGLEWLQRPTRKIELPYQRGD